MGVRVQGSKPGGSQLRKDEKNGDFFYSISYLGTDKGTGHTAFSDLLGHFSYLHRKFFDVRWGVGSSQ